MQWCEALSCSLLYIHVMWFTASVAASPSFSSSSHSSSSSSSTSSNAGQFKPDWMPRLCTCFKRHPQTVFCDSDFVLRVVVLQNPQNRMRRFRGSRQTLMNFPVEIREIFKGGHIFLSYSPFRGRLRARLFSPFMPSCTISDVRERKEYVLMGQMVEGKPVVSKCSWIKQKEELTVRQWRGLRSKYAENCHICQIKYCDTSDCPHEQFKCNLNVFSDVSECYHKETFCLRKQSRHLRHGFHCRWASSKTRLGDCIRDNRFCLRNPRFCRSR